jgi:hypothetical protein
MRPKRTTDEIRILERLDSQLEQYGIQNSKIVEEIIDRPDILINHDSGRLGIEISRLDFEEYCKWLNVPPEPPYSRAGEVTINLNKLLSTCMQKKDKKYSEYKRLRSLNECWLILFNNVFDFKEIAPKKGVPDRVWFEKYSHWELQELSCRYDKVLFNLEHPNQWYLLYDKSTFKQRTQGISGWPSIIYKEAMVQLGPGVTKIDLSDSIPKDEFE